MSGKRPSRKKAAGDALRESEEMYRTLVKASPEAVTVTDLEGRITYASQRTLDLHGVASAEGLVGKSAFEFIAPEDRERAAQNLRRTLERGVVRDLEYTLLRKDGSPFAGEMNAALIRDAQGNPRAFIATVRDITERRRSEEALRRQLAAIEASMDGMAILGENEEYIYLNQAHATLYGCDSPRELVGKSWKVLYHKDELRRFEQEVMPVLRREGRWRGEAVGKKRDGSTFQQEVSLTALEDGGLICVVRDITERKTLEEQLRYSQKMEAVARLAGGVAHDFNNLLTVISGYSKMVYDALAPNDALRKDMEEIRKAGERATNLTRQLLAFGRRQVFETRVLNLNAILGELTRILERILGEDIELEIIPAKGLGSVRADPGQIEQILLNLGVNARDAMPTGGKLTIETGNTLVDGEDAGKRLGVGPGPYVLLSVRDTGTGMDEQVRSRAFEPFFTTKEEGRGTGLGLSTVYGIVKQSGGNVWIDSRPGKGTDVRIYLPRVDAPPDPVPVREAASEPPSGAETVLVLEDDAPVRGLTARILRGRGYTVLEARDGHEALHLAERCDGRIDLLLTDVVMPGMSGPELARQLERVQPELRVLYISGYADDAIVQRGVLDHGVHFLQKPFTLRRLSQKVREALDSGPRGPGFEPKAKDATSTDASEENGED